MVDRVRLGVPQPTEWQRIGDDIKAAFVFARADFVKVRWLHVWLGLRMFFDQGGNENVVELSGTRIISRWGIADQDGVLRNAFW